MITLGLTGGIGSGKTTAAGFFVKEGYHSIDTDAIVHDLLANDRELIEEISVRFGAEMLCPGGGVDRARLGARVFADSASLEWLEGMIHPLVGARWREEISRQGGEHWVVQIPLLFEKKLEQFFDFTVCVGTSAETQGRRLLQRGLSAEEAERRISRQLPLEEKTARADFVLLNDGSPAFLREQVQRLCRQLDPARPRCSS